MKSPRQKSPIVQTVDALVEQAQQAADQTDNLLTEVIAAVKTSISGGVDPYLLVGVLLESIAQVLAIEIPRERRPAIELATLIMLKQRLAPPNIMCGNRPDS